MTCTAAPGVYAATAPATVVYEEVATELTSARASEGDLWITTEDLTRATGFEVKPQGVCRDELCFPLPRECRRDFLHEEGKTRWFHLTEFAKLVRQPFAYSSEVNGSGTWYFGLRAD